MMTTLLFVLVAAVVFGVGYMIYSGMQTQQTQDTIANTVSNAPASNAGKPATLSVQAIDPRVSGDTQVAAKLYVITDPVIGTDSITGTFAADGDSLATSGRTDVTSGINVGTKYLAVASNSTYLGFPTEVKTVASQSENLDLEVHSQATHLQITMKDEDDNALGESGATRNLTLAASDAATIGEIKIKVNASNVAVNLGGFYTKLNDNTNISSVEKTGTQDFEKSTLNLLSTTGDDYVFLFSTPKLLLEQQTLTISDGLTLKTNTGGCGASNNEDIVFYFFDKVWVKSTDDTNKMIYAYETDVESATDVGMTNDIFTLRCSAA